jgi:hypothetical protein
MFQNIAKYTIGIPPLSTNTVQSCQPCITGKPVLNPKVNFSKTSQQPKRAISFLEALFVDICGPIEPASGPFRYFMIIRDATSKFTHTTLLSTKDTAFPRLLTQLFRLKNHFPDYRIKTIYFDNAKEFLSKTFAAYCDSIGITIKTSLPYEHNCPAETGIKLVQSIARPILLQSNLPPTAWGHAILHASDLLNLRPATHTQCTPTAMATNTTPNISFLRSFGAAVYVPINPTKRTKLGPRRILGIYIGFESPSIIRYLDPISGKPFTAKFSNCVFDENTFPKLQDSEKPFNPTNDTFTLTQPIHHIQNPEHFSGHGEREVQCLLHLHNFSKHSPEIFVPHNEIIKSHNPVKSITSQISTKPQNIPQRQKTKITPISQTCNQTSLILYNKQDPKDIYECRMRSDWEQWQQAISAEVASFKKHNVFGTPQETPHGFSPIGYRWIFTQKRDGNGNVIRHKARLVAQGFSQKFGTYYDMTYSPVIDFTSFRWLLNFTIQHDLEMQMVDIQTAYLYGSLDKEIYMKVPSGFPEFQDTKGLKNPSVCLHKSIYGLKQAGRIWYKHLESFLKEKHFSNHQIAPCVFIKYSKGDFTIICIYVDDINIIGTTPTVTSAKTALTSKFQVRDLGPTSFCLGLQIERTASCIFLHQKTYTQDILKKFNMSDANPIHTPMIV